MRIKNDDYLSLFESWPIDMMGYRETECYLS